MVDTEKRYYIIDDKENFYKVCGKQGLTRVKNREEADTFTLREANDRLGSGKKSHFYHILEAELPSTTASETISISQTVSMSETKTPTMFDGLNNDWEGVLTKLCYMSAHICDYQSNLNQMLSDVDKEICDILHCIEFKDLDETEMISITRLLKDKRLHRREIKNEMERTEMMKSTFLDGAFDIKVHQGLELMERMKFRTYTPRKLPELFTKAS